MLQIAPTIHDTVALNSAHYLLGTLASMRRVTIASLEDDTDVLPIMYYGITIAKSGAGKDRSVSLAQSMAKTTIEKYFEGLAKTITKYNGSMSRINAPLIDQEPVLEFMSGTTEGFANTRDILQKIGFGCCNYRISELGDMARNADFNELLTMMVMAWEKGDTPAKIVKTTKVIEVKGVPTNMLLYGSPSKIKDDENIDEKITNAMTSGLGRRSFVVYEDEYNSNLDEVSDVELLAQRKKKKDGVDELESIDSYLSDLMVSGHKNISCSDEAYLAIKRYELECKKKAEKNKTLTEPMIAELNDRAWKAYKLAGLYAWANGSDTVSEEDVKDAIEWAEACSDGFIKLVTKKTTRERIFDLIIRSDKPISRDEIATGLSKISKQELDHNIQMLHEYAERKDFVLIEEQQNKKYKYSLKEVNTVDENNITLSGSKDLAHNYIERSMNWLEIEKVLKGEVNYSAGTFIDGHRTKDNYKGTQDIIILDVDEGMSLSLAKQFFSEWQCVIATTRNHNKEKNGKTNDRFRVVLLPNKKIELDSSKFSELMRNVANKLCIQVDEACFDSSRMYFGNKDAEVWFSPSKNRFDISCCIPDTKRETEQREISRQNDAIISAEGVEKYFLMKIESEGQRNNNLLKYCLMMKDAGEDYTAKTLGLNSMLVEPLSELEIERTIFRTASKK